MKWMTDLIKLYCAVCDNNNTIEYLTQRLSNNSRPEFTDAECITVYLWGLSRHLFRQKAIWQYAKDHLPEWFPCLPSYQSFNRGLNFLAPAIQGLAETWTGMLSALSRGEEGYAVDSCRPFSNGFLYADKAYCDAAWEEELKSTYSVTLLTPRKKPRGGAACSGDSYSEWVSSRRQPVEGFFSWLNAETEIQSASRVRPPCRAVGTYIWKDCHCNI